jgi:hypothetical protein
VGGGGEAQEGDQGEQEDLLLHRRPALARHGEIGRGGESWAAAASGLGSRRWLASYWPY